MTIGYGTEVQLTEQGIASLRDEFQIYDGDTWGTGVVVATGEDRETGAPMYAALFPHGDVHLQLAGIRYVGLPSLPFDDGDLTELVTD